jgi:hypothetical protein
VFVHRTHGPVRSTEFHGGTGKGIGTENDGDRTGRAIGAHRLLVRYGKDWYFVAN